MVMTWPGNTLPVSDWPAFNGGSGGNLSRWTDTQNLQPIEPHNKSSIKTATITSQLLSVTPIFSQQVDWIIISLRKIKLCLSSVIRMMDYLQCLIPASTLTEHCVDVNGEFPVMDLCRLPELLRYLSDMMEQECGSYWNRSKGGNISFPSIWHSTLSGKK